MLNGKICRSTRSVYFLDSIAPRLSEHKRVAEKMPNLECSDTPPNSSHNETLLVPDSAGGVPRTRAWAYWNLYVVSSQRRSVKASVVKAICFLLAAFYCFYWAYSHGAFGNKPVEIPIRAEEKSLINIPFSVGETGYHDIKLRYPNDASDDLDRSLNGLTGKATLLWNGTVLLEADLPVHRRDHDGHSIAMVLCTVKIEPHKYYTLRLEVNSLPSDLRGAQPTVKIETDFYQNQRLAIVLIVSFITTIFGLLYAIQALRNLRTSRQSNGSARTKQSAGKKKRGSHLYI